MRKVYVRCKVKHETQTGNNKAKGKSKLADD